MATRLQHSTHRAHFNSTTRFPPPTSVETFSARVLFVRTKSLTTARSDDRSARSSVYSWIHRLRLTIDMWLITALLNEITRNI